MFLEPKQYEHVIQILSGKIKLPPLLVELQDWARKELETEVYEFVCDYAVSGLIRLQIILWDRDDYREMICSGNLDPQKQKKIADEIKKRILKNSKA